MDTNKALANVRLHIPAVTVPQFNKYLLAALDEINAHGVERALDVTVTSPVGEYDSDPMNRTDSQAFNYYPLSKALVIPESVVAINKVFYDDREVHLNTMAVVSAGYYGVNYYYQSESGELYFNIDLTSGSSVRLIARAGGLSPFLLPDTYLPYLSYTILAGLASNEYKNSDMYAIYSAKARQAKMATTKNKTKASWIKRNGRLY